ncbi:MAG: bifunctional phosphoserine phosphatase/homoserine phosphotransferase ThrH [Lentisphaeria bacterium]|jgi:phosphoserine/homoserine phosphotransferase
MYKKPVLVAADLEGVFVPEIWIAVAEKTGIEKLRLTTRDIPDYDRLMRGRLQILREHKLTLADIQAVIRTLDPLPGAADFLTGLRQRYPVVILSDTFQQFAGPLMLKLGLPTLFCNSLEVAADGSITDYHLRIPNGKQQAVQRFRELNFRVVATGDSYNDTTMLAEADFGILFRPSANVRQEFPQFQVAEDYATLYSLIRADATNG